MESWESRLSRTADLEYAYRTVPGSCGFVQDVCRGRVRSLQCRLDDARGYFEAAATRPVVGDTHDVLWALKLLAYDRENEILRNQNPPTLERMPVLNRMRDVLYRLVEAIDSTSALAASCRGEHYAARIAIQRLLDNHTDATPGQRAMWCVAIAACEASLGLTASAVVRLETAALYTHYDGSRLNQARQCALIALGYEWLGLHDEAASWDVTLEGLNCPHATKTAMRRRAAALRAASNSERLVLI